MHMHKQAYVSKLRVDAKIGLHAIATFGFWIPTVITFVFCPRTSRRPCKQQFIENLFFV